MTNTAVVFPGQGSQRVGMAQDFCQAYPESQQVFRLASEAIELDLTSVCFTENDRLGQTEFTQPAILTAEIAMLTAARQHFNFSPTHFGGHSLGEYTALVAAGVIPLADAVRIVRKRGALMQQAVPVGRGAMAALVFDDITSTSFEQVVTQASAEVANFNSKNQVVISGKKEAVELACSNLRTKYPEMNTIMLDVSAPFHSSLMKEIEPEFKEYLIGFEKNFNLTNVDKVISNFYGGFHSKDRLVQGLVSQISGSVHWLRNMEALGAASTDLVEIGPARILSKFFSTLGITTKWIIDMRSLKKNLTAQDQT